jgi:hypothetical protein
VVEAPLNSNFGIANTSHISWAENAGALIVIVKLPPDGAPFLQLFDILHYIDELTLVNRNVGQQPDLVEQ